VETILFLGILVALAWLKRLSGRTSALETEISKLRSAMANPAAAVTAAPGADEAPAVEPLPDAGEAIGDAPDEPVSETLPSPDDEEWLPGKTEPRKKRTSAELEALIGARWSVILGGITVALGALFLVRYSIEAGLLGPKARIAAGALLAVGLFATGEWLRRRDQAMALPVIAKADIPGVITGAGVVAAFGTLYAAHAIYGFVGPAVAFVGLTLIGLVSLALSAVHGPKLAAIGILGAYGAPILVSSSAPNPLAITLHTLVVTASVMTVARLRGWLWLAIAGVVGGSLWALLITDVFDPQTSLFALALLIGLAVIYAVTFGWQLADRPSPLEDRRRDIPALGAFIILALVFVFHAGLLGDYPLVAGALVLALIASGTAVTWPALGPVSGTAAFIAVMATTILDLDLVDLPGLYGEADFAKGLVPPDIAGYLRDVLMMTVPVAALLLFGAYRAAATAPRMAGALATSTSLIAVFGLIATYLRITPFETHMPTGFTAIALAAGFVVLTEWFTRARPGDWQAPAPAAFAVAAVSLIGLAIGIMSSKLFMPLGFALIAAGIAVVYRARPLAALPILAIVAAALGALGVWASAPFAGETIGATPFLNKLIVLAGLPAVAILFSGEVLRRNDAPRSASIVTTLGLAALAFFVALELRHWISGGSIASPSFGLADMAAQTIAALGFAIGLQRVARLTGATIYDWASLAAGAISVAMIIGGLGLFHNPLIWDSAVGEGAFFNMLLPAYLVTALLAAVVAWMARPVRPRWYTLGYALVSGILLFLYVTLMVRHAFHGDRIGFWRSTSDAELWTYSAAWLILGSIVLALGLYLRSLPLRLASAILIGLTILKVFLLDMSALTGAYRAFSFIGLGISLLLIGRFYQRVVLRTAGESSPPPEPEADEPEADK
jgi:uncharacterized membrane protein